MPSEAGGLVLPLVDGEDARAEDLAHVGARVEHEHNHAQGEVGDIYARERQAKERHVDLEKSGVPRMRFT